MARNKTKNQVHVSPGVYFSETEITAANTSLGITNLGIAGETLKGPAFQPIEINSWAEFQDYFGGTSTEKFRGSQYPKYELPYIAKTYLEQSRNLKVSRVLGLSGVNAGKAWLITAYFDNTNGKEYKGQLGTTDDNGTKQPYYSADKPVVIAVLRSRGEHRKAAFLRNANADAGECQDVYEYDNIFYYAENVKIGPSPSLTLVDGCNPGWNSKNGNLEINVNNYGTFSLEVELNGNDDPKKTKVYSVSFNPSDKNYIYNVLGGSAEDGETEIYVEELYDVALRQLIENGELNTLGNVEENQYKELNYFDKARIVPGYAPVDSILTEDESMLSRKDVGKRFLFHDDYSVNAINGQKLKVHTRKESENTWMPVEGENGHIYTVVAYTTTEGTREYYYGEVEGKAEVIKKSNTEDGIFSECVFVNSDNLYYAILNVKTGVEQYSIWILDGKEVEALTPGAVEVRKTRDKYEDKLRPITIDLNNYKEQFRFSSTPWIVSELKGSGNEIELTKLFRFHTISDGDNSRNEVKVSIENIEPSEGTFDVVVRDFHDTDSSPIILERFQKCNLIPGTSNYIALKIGSYDETYEIKSKYVTVEVNEGDAAQTSVPCGFLGYPVRDYEGGIGVNQHLNENVSYLHKPYLQYNTIVYDDLRPKKQYFGMSDLVGIDDDVLKYKGVEAYNDIPSGLTPCFHLDSRILEGIPDSDGFVSVNDVQGNKIRQRVKVDGVTGYQWVTVGKGNTLANYGVEPRIGNEIDMMNTIYEDKRYRKFTLCFYGGFDGWDYYRTSRSNTDEFTYRNYRGKINNISGEGVNFSMIRDVEYFNFEKGMNTINSDYYAYLGAIRQFANPKEIDINVFATPGIDYVNNNLLVQETIDMIEEERADSIYVITTPDKPYGMSDNKMDMYTASEAVDNLEASEIDSNWACTYYPWVKYFDSQNNQYIYLPPTKDVVKNFAYTDNVAAPWFASAGWFRGLTDGIRPKKNLVLSEQDELYGGRINYINTFADDGLRVWGDKNLQINQDSQLSRISKRRCLIRLRKLISIACIGLVFDPNDNTMVSSFRSAIEPILENFCSNRALYDAKLVIDDSVESRDRLELNAQIYIKFIPNVEYINIGLVVTPQGVSFEDI